MRVLCIDAPSQYALINAFLAATSAGFAEAGHHVVRVDVQTLIDHGPPANVDLAFSMGGAGAGLAGDIPLCTWLVDHPVWSPGVEQMVPERDGILVVDAAHVGALRDFLGYSVAAGFVPHGIEPPATRPDFSDDERDIDVLLCATYDRRSKPTDGTTAANATLQMAFKLADDRWDHHMRELQVSDLYVEAADANLVPRTPSAHRAVAGQLAWLDAHIRERRRVACVRALDDAGVPVHLVGAGWEAVEGLTHAVVCGPVDHHELLAMARRAKIVCNAGPPLFNQGWHERIPLAMVTGALSVTETNDWISGDPLLSSLVETFEMRDHEHLGDIVRAALEDPQRTSRARASYELVRNNHTWAHRGRAIVEMLEL